MILHLPYPPSVNTYWRRHGHVIHLSKAGKKFRFDVLAAVLAAFGKPTAIEGRLSVEMEVFFPDRRQRDIDNLVKSTLDALTHAGVWKDDSQVKRLHVFVSQKNGVDAIRKGGGCRVEINKLEERL